MENIFDFDVLDTDAIKHKVTIYWKCTFGDATKISTLEKRSGYFEEYAEAEYYAKCLNNDYMKLDFPFVIYIGSNIKYNNKLIEFNSFVKAYKEAKER